MEITINVVEIASLMAERDLINASTDFDSRYLFPNGIVVEQIVNGVEFDEYTPEAQKYFDQQYDYWYNFLVSNSTY